jgi:hypothetical protein
MSTKSGELGEGQAGVLEHLLRAGFEDELGQHQLGLIRNQQAGAVSCDSQKIEIHK